MIFGKLIVVALVATTVISGVVSGQSQTCADVSLIFVRGSGQNKNSEHLSALTSKEFKEVEPQSYAFFNEVSKRLKNLSVEKISLHDFSGKYNKYGYDAVDVATGMKTKAQHRKDVINRYYESVADGKEELLGFLRERISACPYQRIVVGGYSQGAHVVGDAMHALSPYDRTHISYVSLFGDPKYNPRVPGLLLSRANWARGNSAAIYSGILGGRSTYLPEDLRYKTSWCDRSDPICSGSRLGDPGLKALVSDFLDKTHSNAYQNRWISHAANDIAIKITNNARMDKTIGSVLVNDEHPTKKLDVMLVIDTTGYMNYEIRQLQRLPVLQKFVGSVYGQNWDTRVGVVIYNDNDHPYNGFTPWLSQTLQDLTYNRTSVVNAIGRIYPGNMANRDAAMYSGIMTAIKGQDWRNNAQKKIIIISNTKARNPDPGPEKYKEQDVVKAMLNLDPAVGSVINLPDIQTNSRPATDSAASLATQSNGLLIDGSFASDQTIATIESSLSELDNSPVAIISDPPEYGNNFIELSAGESYDPDSSITKYEWDCNDDGIWDITSEQPSARCEYTTNYVGPVFVQVTSADGQSAKGMLIVNTEINPATVSETKSPTLLDPPALTTQRLNESSALIAITNPYSSGATFTIQRQDSEELIEFEGSTYEISGITSGEFEYCIYASYGGVFSELACDTVAQYEAPEPEEIPIIEPTQPKEVTLEESGKFVPNGESNPLGSEIKLISAIPTPQISGSSSQQSNVSNYTGTEDTGVVPTQNLVTTVAGIETKAPTTTQATATVVARQTPELTILLIALGLLGVGTVALLWRLNKKEF